MPVGLTSVLVVENVEVLVNCVVGVNASRCSVEILVVESVEVLVDFIVGVDASGVVVESIEVLVNCIVGVDASDCSVEMLVVELVVVIELVMVSAVCGLGSFRICPICRLYQLTPGLAESSSSNDIPARAAMSLPVSPATTV